jgi:hypothetical protein
LTVPTYTSKLSRPPGSDGGRALAGAVSAIAPTRVNTPAIASRVGLIAPPLVEGPVRRAFPVTETDVNELAGRH